MRATDQTDPGELRQLPLLSRLLLRLERPGPDGTGPLPPACDVRVEPDLRVPLRDGAELLADHYVPDLPAPCPTVLAISPYGRRFPFGHLFGVQLARQGLHAVVVSSRGTAGSGGAWRPFQDDVPDAADSVEWLRGRPWFDGRLGMIGASYLGYTQLATAAGDPPELRAMVLLAPVVRPAAVWWPGGACGLEGMVVSGLGIEFSARGMRAMVPALVRAARKFPRVSLRQPFIDHYPEVFGGRLPSFEGFLTHPDPDDVFWAGTDLRGVADTTTAGVLLVGGWWDPLLDQTLDLHARLVAAGRDVRLLVGPWTHTSMVEAAGWPVVHRAAVEFLRSRLGAADPSGGAGRRSPDDDGPRVRVHVGGEAGGVGSGGVGSGGVGWQEFESWPPPGGTPTNWLLGPGGWLGTAPASPGDPSVIEYDPADPTPSRGGATLGRTGGVVDNRWIEARTDVLVFTSQPLEADVEVLGPVAARLTLRVRGSAADVFVRLCDVDPAGHSRNVTDGIVRLDPDPDVFGPDGGTVTVPMMSTAYRFRAGHRVRVQVSGGSHPRFARNPGTGEPFATATGVRPATIELRHEPDRPSAVVLPVRGRD